MLELAARGRWTAICTPIKESISRLLQLGELKPSKRIAPKPTKPGYGGFDVTLPAHFLKNFAQIDAQKARKTMYLI